MRTIPRKSLLEIYDRQYFEKLECLLKQASYKYVIKIIQSLVTKHIRFGKKAIDIGCGYGWLLRTVRDLGCDTFGVDISRYGIKKAINALKGVNLLCADCHHLPFRNQTFDFVTSIWLLEHVMYPPRALKEIYRITKTRGLAIIMAPTPELYGIRKRDILKPEFFSRLGDEHVHDFSPAYLENLVRWSGFIMTEKRGIFRDGSLNLFTFPIFKIAAKYRRLRRILLIAFYLLIFPMRLLPEYVHQSLFFKLEILLSDKTPFNLFGEETAFICLKI